MKLGGSVYSVTSIRQCEASLQGLSVEEVQMCLEAEASATAKVTFKAEVKHCKKDTEKMETKSSFSGLFNDRYRTFTHFYCIHADRSVFGVAKVNLASFCPGSQK